MRYNIAIYSLKIWLTSVITGSIRLNYSHYTNNLLSDTFEDFILFCIIQLIFSFVIWLIYMLILKLALGYTNDVLQAKIFSAMICIAITILAFWVLSFSY